MYFMDIIFICHVTIYLARNFRPIFHIYSFSVSDCCITSDRIIHCVVMLSVSFSCSIPIYHSSMRYSSDTDE